VNAILNKCPYCGGDESKCDFDWKTDRCSQMGKKTTSEWEEMWKEKFDYSTLTEK